MFVLYNTKDHWCVNQVKTGIYICSSIDRAMLAIDRDISKCTCNTMPCHFISFKNSSHTLSDFGRSHFLFSNVHYILNL